MPVTTAGWYKLTLNAQDYYLAADPKVRTTVGWAPIPIAGLEGFRNDAVFNGYMDDISVELLSSPTGAAANFANIEALHTARSAGDLASANWVNFALVRKTGNSLAGFSGNCTVASVERNLSTKAGATATVVIEAYTAAPAL